MVDYYQLVTDKERDFKGLHDRMDRDKDLFNLKPFILREANNRIIDNVQNVTRNDPRTLANHIQSILIGAKRQIEVEGKGLKTIEDKKTTIVESFLGDILDEIDSIIWKTWLRIPNLRAFLSQQICVRGSIASRYYQRVENKLLVPDLLPIDTRYLTYESGGGSLEWAAYKTKRSRAKISAEYEVTVAGKVGEVCDFWDDTFERIYVEQKLVKEQKHGLGYVPFVVQLCPLGSMLMDDDVLKYSGESIYDSLRDIFTGSNEVASIVHTTTHYGLKPPLQYESEGGEDTVVEKLPYGEGATDSVEPGGGFKAMPLIDIHNAARNDYAMFDRRRQTGGISAVNFGALTQQLSAVAISKLTDMNKQQYDPRLQALSIFYEELADMIIGQFVKGKTKAELGRKGQKRHC